MLLVKHTYIGTRVNTNGQTTTLKHTAATAHRMGAESINIGKI